MNHNITGPIFSAFHWPCIQNYILILTSTISTPPQLKEIWTKNQEKKKKEQSSGNKKQVPLGSVLSAGTSQLMKRKPSSLLSCLVCFSLVYLRSHSVNCKCNSIKSIWNNTNDLAINPVKLVLQLFIWSKISSSIIHVHKTCHNDVSYAFISGVLYILSFLTWSFATLLSFSLLWSTWVRVPDGFLDVLVP